MYYKLTMFKPSETANDLFRRLNNRAFNLRTRPDRMEQLLFGSTVEVQMNTPEISEVSWAVFGEIGLHIY